MSKYVSLNPSQRPTVAAVGEFAYKEALRRVPTGTVMLEVVPEPDNPYDNRAISIRHNGSVIGYVPRDRTKTYWNVVARVAASGKIARVKGRVYSNPSSDYYEVSVFLLGSEKALAGTSGLVSKSSDYSVPNAYIDTAPSMPPNSTQSSAATFTQAEVDAETERRRSANPTSTPASSPKLKGSKFPGCATGALVVGILLILLL